MNLSSESFVFDPRPNYPLVSTVRRYWDPSAPVDQQALTLVFTHGTGFHKEHWEAVIEDLWKLYSKGPKGLKIGEVWTIDAPNHGDAAILNEKVLAYGYQPIFRWEEYARSIHAFLAGLGTGVNVDFGSRRLVGIGHSMGASSFILSTSFSPAVKYEALILVEPMIFDIKKARISSNFLEEGAVKRRDVWPSKTEASAALLSRPSWKAWDPRIFEAYIEHGLRSLPTLDHPQGQGVTLKCTKLQEAACYRDSLALQRCFDLLEHIAKRFPTHMVYGAINDAVSKEAKEDVISQSNGKLASIVRIQGSGHLVTQTAPQRLAEEIYTILGRTDTARPKL